MARKKYPKWTSVSGPAVPPRDPYFHRIDSNLMVGRAAQAISGQTLASDSPSLSGHAGLP